MPARAAAPWLPTISSGHALRRHVWNVRGREGRKGGEQQASSGDSYSLAIAAPPDEKGKGRLSGTKGTKWDSQIVSLGEAAIELNLHLRRIS